MRNMQYSEKEQKPNRVIERMKIGVAVLMVAGAIGCKNNSQYAQQSPPTPAPITAPSVAPSSAPAPAPRSAPSAAPNPSPPAPARTPQSPTPARASDCTAFPEINQWTAKRNLDPILVRAVVKTQSDFDSCAVTKVCNNETINTAKNCSPADSTGASQGFLVGYDEMYDPAGKCTINNAAPGETPDWRTLGVGLMQLIEPPYTFWPSVAAPMGRNGQYFDIYDRTGLNLKTLPEAQACNERFNPFDMNDNLCLGTAKLSVILGEVKNVLALHKGIFGNSPKNEVTVFVLGNMYSGVWGSASRAQDFVKASPGCSSEQANGNCWINSFFESMTVNGAYCGSNQGDTKCKDGKPRMEPPYVCYGYTDFVKFVKECRTPFLSPQLNPGESLLREYDRLVLGCKAKPE